MSNPDSISQLLQQYYWYEIKKDVKHDSNPTEDKLFGILLIKNIDKDKDIDENTIRKIIPVDKSGSNFIIIRKIIPVYKSGPNSIIEKFSPNQDYINEIIKKIPNLNKIEKKDLYNKNENKDKNEDENEKLVNYIWIFDNQENYQHYINKSDEITSKTEPIKDTDVNLYNNLISTKIIYYSNTDKLTIPLNSNRTEEGKLLKIKNTIFIGKEIELAIIPDKNLRITNDKIAYIGFEDCNFYFDSTITINFDSNISMDAINFTSIYFRFNNCNIIIRSFNSPLKVISNIHINKNKDEDNDIPISLVFPKCAIQRIKINNEIIQSIEVKKDQYKAIESNTPKNIEYENITKIFLKGKFDEIIIPDSIDTVFGDNYKIKDDGNKYRIYMEAPDKNNYYDETILLSLPEYTNNNGKNKQPIIQYCTFNNIIHIKDNSNFMGCRFKEDVRYENISENSDFNSKTNFVFNKYESERYYTIFDSDLLHKKNVINVSYSYSDRLSFNIKHEEIQHEELESLIFISNIFEKDFNIGGFNIKGNITINKISINYNLFQQNVCFAYNIQDAFSEEKRSKHILEQTIIPDDTTYIEEKLIFKQMQFNNNKFDNNNILPEEQKNKKNKSQLYFSNLQINNIEFSNNILETSTFNNIILKSEKNKYIDFSNNEYNGKARFVNNAEIKNNIIHPITFSRSSFKEVEFQNYIFEEDVSFNNSRFNNNLSFINTNFEKDIHFKDIEFAGEVCFQNVMFNSSKLHSSLKFINSDFAEKVSLDGKIFYKDIVFEDVSFKKYISFEKSIFFGKTTFKDVNCEGKAIFNDAQFNGKTEFSDIMFKENAKANFNDSRFFNKATFHKVHFSDNAYFERVKFNDVATFQYITFTNFASFKDAIFNENIDFKSSTAEKTITFNGATFKKAFNFVNLFVEKISFLGIKIHEENGKLSQFRQYFDKLQKYKDLVYKKFDFNDKSNINYNYLKEYYNKNKINNDKINNEDFKILKKYIYDINDNYDRTFIDYIQNNDLLPFHLKILLKYKKYLYRKNFTTYVSKNNIKLPYKAFKIIMQNNNIKYEEFCVIVKKHMKEDDLPVLLKIINNIYTDKIESLKLQDDKLDIYFTLLKNYDTLLNNNLYFNIIDIFINKSVDIKGINNVDKDANKSKESKGRIYIAFKELFQEHDITYKEFRILQKHSQIWDIINEISQDESVLELLIKHMNILIDFKNKIAYEEKNKITYEDFRRSCDIIKHSLDNVGQKIDANKFYALSLLSAEQEFKGDAKMINLDSVILSINKITSNHGQSWLLPLLWIVFISEYIILFNHLIAYFEMCFNIIYVIIIGIAFIILSIIVMPFILNTLSKIMNTSLMLTIIIIIVFIVFFISNIFTLTINDYDLLQTFLIPTHTPSLSGNPQGENTIVSINLLDLLKLSLHNPSTKIQDTQPILKLILILYPVILKGLFGFLIYQLINALRFNTKR
jgi:hypothetical protein